MKKALFQTTNEISPLILRIMLGIVVFPHGAQKLFGWLGGPGFAQTMTYFVDYLGLPGPIGFLVIILESFGAVLLIFGLATRLLAVSYVILALGIIFSSHLEHGFFMNWLGNQSGEGYEYFLLWIGISLSLVLSGGGAFSLDGRLIK